MKEKGAPPLVSWDGLHLMIDLPLLEDLLQEWLRGVDEVRDLLLLGGGDAVRVLATLVVKGVAVKVGLEIAEIRLRRTHLGFRIRRPKVLGGMRVPRGLVERLSRRYLPPEVTLFPGQGIVVVNLGRWLPAQLELCILTVQATERVLHIWFGPGRLDHLPAPARPALVASTE